MKKIKILTSFLQMVFYLLCMVFAMAAWGQAIPKAVQDARDSVFRVVYFAGDEGGSATAWAINENTLLTNAHVVDDFLAIQQMTGENGSIYLINNQGQEIAVVDFHSFDNVDMATLSIAGGNLKPLKIQPGEFEIGLQLWNLSYPGVSDLYTIAKEAQLSQGYIQEYFTAPADGRFNITRSLKHDAASGPGSSGSPIFNQCGNVIGLHNSGVSDDLGAGLPGASRYAISSQVVVDFLKEESRSTEFTLASSCSSLGSIGGVKAIFILVALLALAAGLFLWFKNNKAQSKSNQLPDSPISSLSKEEAKNPQLLRETENGDTLILESFDAEQPFEIQARFEQGKNILKIGSSDAPERNNDLILEFPSVSRTHAQIEKLGKSLLLMDLGSSNGTFVQGERLVKDSPKNIESGEVISLANIKVKVILK